MDYDYPVSLEHADSVDKEEARKKEQLSSSIRNYEYASEDYDRRYGKGSFFKKFPETKTVLDALYSEKVECMNKLAKAALKEA